MLVSHQFHFENRVGREKITLFYFNILPPNDIGSGNFQNNFVITFFSNNSNTIICCQRSMKLTFSYQVRKELSGKWSHSYIHGTLRDLGSDFFNHLFVMCHKMC